MMGKLAVRNVNYWAETFGKGEPLVLLHGFTGSGETWGFLKNSLKKYQLVLIDIIGHGQTDSPENPERYRMEEAVEDLKEILLSLNIRKAHVLGYSMGGRLALSFAMRQPEFVKTLILESSSPGLKTEKERETRRLQDERLAQMILDEGIAAFVQHWENIPLFLTQKSLPPAVKDKIRKDRLKNNAIGLANSLKGMGTGVQPSWWGALKSFNIPTLLICGERDLKFCKIMKEMNQLIPCSELKIVPQVGHAVHVEQSKFFGKIIYEFLQHFSTY
uniref:2-succinyl-6-hydroxy-2, 4-cyclohexadiene-1-carboxylate synthase n=1 Tax=Aeribacillus sp. FSL k6-2211 TaxID=2954608 RepID=UPI00403F0FF4